MLRLYNSLTKEKEVFKPITDGKVGMYTCGPTVYDFAHIGNLRSFVFADLLRRTLLWNNYDVTHVMNITDVGHLSGSETLEDGDDKMTKGLRREGKELNLENMRALAEKYTEAFETDLKALNILHPDELPRATDHIEKQIELIQALFDKDIAYATSDGVYFDVSKYPEYGKLGGLTDSENVQHRVLDNPEKHSPRDFALWKFNDQLGWNTPWGTGFPGWHIECSAMSMQYLGEQFDIHTGGIDNKPTHHNNELAQSESVTGKQFVKVWMHGEHVNLAGGAKMAKSAGTGLTLQALREQGFDPLVYRYWLLTAHYRSPIDFSEEALTAAKTAFEKLTARVLALGPAEGTAHADYLVRFTDAVNDDLGLPEALALAWELLKDADVIDEDKKATLFEMDKVFGLGLHDIKAVIIPPEVQALVDAREQARAEKDWAKSDELRDQIATLGFTVKDTDQGPVITLG